jgi:SAM-dependent methyltransferase
MSSILNSKNDPMGLAIYDFHKTGKAKKLIVHSSMFDDDEIPVTTLFRKFKDMPELEQVALKQAEGRILDVGAGSGCHCVALAEMGKSCTAIDISELSVEVMKEKGVDARCIDLFDENFVGQYDTILMLMNGTGIIGRLENMQKFFIRMKHLLAPGGRILIDSSDLRYLFEEEDGSLMIDLADDYYGLVDFQMEYNKVLGEPFDWLYVDFDTLSLYAEQNGFKAEMIAEGEHYDYLAALSLA